MYVVYVVPCIPEHSLLKELMCLGSLVIMCVGTCMYVCECNYTGKEEIISAYSGYACADVADHNVPDHLRTCTCSCSCRLSARGRP